MVPARFSYPSALADHKPGTAALARSQRAAGLSSAWLAEQERRDADHQPCPACGRVAEAVSTVSAVAPPRPQFICMADVPQGLDDSDMAALEDARGRLSGGDLHVQSGKNACHHHTGVELFGFGHTGTYYVWLCRTGYVAVGHDRGVLFDHAAALVG
jgi:hypothetical protein